MGTAQRVEDLYTAHGRLVSALCRSLLRDRAEAEDAVQQTFLSAHRALANGSAPREPAAWLATIARNECLARARERMREPLPLEAEPAALGADAYAVALSRLEVATLREALAGLPRMQREAILLRELRGLSYDEVARALSVTTGAVESLIFRARRTLQMKLRQALPALSPVGLLGRLLGGGGDLVGPAAVKLTAIGVGAAVLAGGAAFAPHAFWTARPATTAHHHSKPPAHVQAAPRPPVVAPTPRHIPSLPAVEPAASRQSERDSSVSERSSSSDAVETATPEKEYETPAASPATPAPAPATHDASDDSGSDDSSGADN